MGLPAHWRNQLDHSALAGRDRKPESLIEITESSSAISEGDSNAQRSAEPQHGTDGPANLAAEQRQAFAAAIKGLLVRNNNALVRLLPNVSKPLAIAALRRDQGRKDRLLLFREQVGQFINWMQAYIRQRPNR